MTTREEYEVRLAAWLVWMRDPATKQTRGQMRDAEGGMCCLAGLCEIKEPEHGWQHRSGGKTGFQWNDDKGTANYPPLDVWQWFGLANEGGQLDNFVEDAIYRTVYWSLDALNDNAKWTLPQIADYIEANKANVFDWAKT